MDAAND